MPVKERDTPVNAPPGSPSVSAREGGRVLEMQRRRLLLAYSEVLAEHGLHGTSVDRVCKRAGVSRRTFYDLFLNREGCFLAALELARERIAAELGVAFADGGRERRWNVRLRAGLTALLELFDAEPALARMCVVETLKGGPQVLAWSRTAIAGLARAVDQGRADGKGDPPSLAAEGMAGGVLSVIYTRLLEPDAKPLVTLVNPLMSMIVVPYLGPEAARRELKAAVPESVPERRDKLETKEPFKDLPIRITFRTARVLDTVGERPGASNRQIADAAGVPDQGQMSKLLRRLADYGLIENSGAGHSRGEPNAWRLTERGEAIRRALRPPVA
jgi:AcrR family transcriptional regulator/DNA-binding MarR family transcriptional regulator